MVSLSLSEKETCQKNDFWLQIHKVQYSVYHAHATQPNVHDLMTKATHIHAQLEILSGRVTQSFQTISVWECSELFRSDPKVALTASSFKLLTKNLFDNLPWWSLNNPIHEQKCTALQLLGGTPSWLRSGNLQASLLYWWGSLMWGNG